MIEKHFTDNNSNEGPDHFFAMNPTTWREMVNRSEELLLALGDGEKRVEENEKQSYLVQRRCICASKDLKSGHVISKNDLFPLRPISENSFQPFEVNNILGKKIKNDMKFGDHFSKYNLI